MANAEAGSSYVARITQAVEILKFAKDWNAPQGEGSKRAKSEFYIRAFQTSPPYIDMYRDVQENKRPHILEEHKQAFATWKKRNEIVVTARNRLLSLYNAVSLLSRLSFRN